MSRKLVSLCLVLGLSVITFAAVRMAMAGPSSGRVSPPAIGDAKESLEQGLTLTFSQGGRTDVRAARLVSLYVPESYSPTPFLSAGPFSATWTGYLNQRLRNEVMLSVLGRGKVVVTIGGNVALEAAGEDFGAKAPAAVKLEKGKNPIEVVYTAPEKGDAWMRLLWASREFPPEPVQPGVLSHDVSAPALRKPARLREGRELLANFRCVRCHAYRVPQADAKRWNMPELETDAPDLVDVGARLREGWMAAWIADPRSMRPDAGMPRVFHGEEGKPPREAADLAAYLATLGKAAAGDQKAPDDEAVAQGGQLFSGLGCIGCHTRPDVEEIDVERRRVPLKWVNAKFQPGALKDWLLDPQKHYAWTRMPNFHLTGFEAERLVAYLTANAKGELPASEVAGDADQGRALFTSAGCANCHAVAPPVALTLKAAAMQQLLEESDWNRGCLAAEEGSRGKAPDFGFSPEQRGALQAIAAAGLSSLHNDVFAEFAERSVRHLQCSACHARDEVDDRWTELSDEVSELMPPEMNIEGDFSAEQAKQEGPRLFYPANVGKLSGGDAIVISGDQSRPPLTWTGEKLRPEWSAAFIAGRVPYKPRYWLRSRMPAYPKHAQSLAMGLSLGHGMPDRSPAAPALKEDLAQLGQKLVGRDGGFACVTCHSVNDSKAISPFEAPAPNLIHVKDRLTHDFYTRWMRKPMRFWPGTKMPEYSEGGKSTLGEVLNGDADGQFEAVWNYILQGERMVPPE